MFSSCLKYGGNVIEKFIEKVDANEEDFVHSK